MTIITRDYGIRPELYDDYFDMVTTITKKEMFDLGAERDAEFEKPFLKDDFAKMQSFHPVNYEIPYLGTMELGLRVEDPPKKGEGKSRATATAQVLNWKPWLSNTSPRTSNNWVTTTSIRADVAGPYPLRMAGKDADENPWKQKEIIWKFVRGGTGQIIFYQNQWQYNPLSAVRTTEFTDYIEGTTPDKKLSSRIKIYGKLYL